MNNGAFWSTLLLTLAGASETAPALTAVRPTVTPGTSGPHDFDFLHGRWQVKNRRLAVRLANSNEWLEFDAATEVKPLPGGLGHLDVYRTDFWPDFVGITLRVYNPDTRQWSLLWVDNHNAPGVLQPAVVGAFDGNVGVFTAADTHEGRPVTVRFIWTVLGDNRARWEQAFSTDDGVSWETNWVMEFTRVSQ